MINNETYNSLQVSKGITEVKSTSFITPKAQYQLLALTWHSVYEKKEQKQAQFKGLHPSLLTSMLE